MSKIPVTEIGSLHVYSYCNQISKQEIVIYECY